MDSEHGLARKRRKPAAVQQLVAEFLGSGISQDEVCRSHEISRSTLCRHLKRHRNQETQGRNSADSCAVVGCASDPHEAMCWIGGAVAYWRGRAGCSDSVLPHEFILPWKPPICARPSRGFMGWYATACCVNLAVGMSLFSAMHNGIAVFFRQGCMT
jgi:hypothetical protein